MNNYVDSLEAELKQAKQELEQHYAKDKLFVKEIMDFKNSNDLLCREIEALIDENQEWRELAGELADTLFNKDCERLLGTLLEED